MARRSQPGTDRTGAAGGQPAQPLDALVVLGRLTDEVVPELVGRLNGSGLGEVEISANGWRVRLRRPPAHAPLAVTAESERGARRRRGEGAPEGGSQAELRAAPQPAAEAAAARPGRLTAPAVGYFVPREDVEAGARVRQGDTVGHVDVLGVREDVVADVDGVLERFEVEAGQAVEYGEPVARLREASG
jgi:acetyl-CoA carboxylase biotin carboxyl carrier protein